MRYLTLNEVLDIYRQVMEQSGGAVGIRDIIASVDEQEDIILRLAAGETSREAFTEWLTTNVVEKG